MSDFLTEDGIVECVSGATDVIRWFGCWPSFHDAEVVSIDLNRASYSDVRIHVFAVTTELNDRGYYKTEKHAIVTFRLAKIVSVALSGFNNQNVLSCLLIKKNNTGIQLLFGECYGIGGHITALVISCSLTPDLPVESTYGSDAA